MACCPRNQEPYIEDLLKQPGPNLPVFALALMPSEGLAAVTEEVVSLLSTAAGVGRPFSTDACSYCVARRTLSSPRWRS